ncbi:MAG: ABC transporter ATP-binding protein [Prevotella sp.]|nr:ABC transporter ATP-binding protein [Prevotella sp.]
MNDIPSIILDNLTIGYKSHHNRKVLAKNIHAELFPGCMTCLIGPNGVGKSTLMRTMAAFQKPLDGTVRLMKKSIGDYSNNELAKTVGVVLTEKPDAINMTVREMVGMGRLPYSGFWGTLNREDEDIVDNAMQRVGIVSLQKRRVLTLSDGERQKVMIAKALAQQTPVILLDEPTAFLDYPSKVEILQLMLRLCREENKTVLLSTHDLELALQIADNLWLMLDNGSLHIGTPRELADRGILTSFIEREGIAFDPKHLSVVVQQFPST